METIKKILRLENMLSICYFFKHLSLSMLISFMLIKEKSEPLCAKMNKLQYFAKYIAKSFLMQNNSKTFSRCFKWCFSVIISLL